MAVSQNKSRTRQVTVSMTMAMDSLREAAEECRRAEQQLANAYAVRNELIRDAKRGRVTYPMLIELTGLGFDRLRSIVNHKRNT